MTKDQKLIFGYSIIAVAFAYISCTDGGDFDVYLDAAKKLANGQNIYGPPYIKDQLQYFYSVFFALILTPFREFVFAAEFVWLLLTFFLLFRIKILIESFLPKSEITEKQNQIWFALSATLALQFIMYEIALIQVTTFLLWSILESVYRARRGQFMIAGIILGVAINIKIMPVLILPYLFYRGYFKTILVCLATFSVLLYLPSLVIGWDYNSFLLSEWWRIINPSNKGHMLETGIGSHSIVTLPVFLMQTDGDMPYQRNLFNLNYDTAMIIINGARLLLLSMSILFLRSLPFKKETDSVKTFWEIAYVIMLIPLLMPHMQKYNFLLVLPMISYILYFFISTFKDATSAVYRLTLIFFIICMTIYSPLYSSDIISRFLFRWTQHYRFLTFATLFIIPVALYCNPTRLKKIVEAGNGLKRPT